MRRETIYTPAVTWLRREISAETGRTFHRIRQPDIERDLADFPAAPTIAAPNRPLAPCPVVSDSVGLTLRAIWSNSAIRNA